MTLVNSSFAPLFSFSRSQTGCAAQSVMTGALSILIFAGLLTVVAIDYPFAGTEPAAVKDFAGGLVNVSARENRPSHRRHTEALGSSAQIRCVSLSYRVMAKRASRVPRINQMLIRITADARVLISSASENPRYRR
jgi:hypothetical protein